MQTIDIPNVGNVEIRKSNRAKRIILSIRHGKPRVTIPTYTPYFAGKQFALSQQAWLKKHAQDKPVIILRPGTVVGSGWVINYQLGEKLSSRVGKDKITITMPPNVNWEDAQVQAEAQKAVKRAIRKQAEQTLPKKLYELAKQHGYQFSEVRIKAMSTRWGSCSSKKIINLNMWLVQLPPEIINYVVLHELTHLNHPHHQAEFWEELGTMEPNYKQLRKSLKQHHPQLIV